MNSSIYLDYASATPLDPRVLGAMQSFFSDNFYNPSADYGPARKVSEAILEARKSIAHIMGAKPSEIIFTAGATEANNLAIHGIMQQFPAAALAISAVEHESVRAPAGMYKNSIIPVDKCGSVDSGTIGQFISHQTVLVSVMYANNEVGTVQPIRRIAAQIKDIRSKRQKSGNNLPLYFHVDAAQASNYLDLHVHRLGADLMTINGGKIYGPKQSGVLFVRSGINLRPQILGGGQERGLRNGTENVPAIIGLAKALEIADQTRAEESKRISKLRDDLESGMVKLSPNAIINGSKVRRLSNNLHVTFPGRDNERLLMELDAKSVYAAAGSACSASTDEPSLVLRAMGLSEQAIRSSIRFSLGRQTTDNDIKSTLSVLSSILA